MDTVSNFIQKTKLYVQVVYYIAILTNGDVQVNTVLTAMLAPNGLTLQHTTFIMHALPFIC